MASGVTKRGRMRILEMAMRNTQDSATADTSPWYLALMTDTAALTVNTIVFDTVKQINIGNGYTDGGDIIARDTATELTVWDDIEDTAGDYGYIRLADHVWTASGGSLPNGGSGAAFAVLLDGNATIGSRQVYAWWDLTEARSVSSGSTITLQDIEIRLTT